MSNVAIERVPSSKEKELVSMVSSDTRFEKYANYLYDQDFEKIRSETYKIANSDMVEKSVHLTHFQQDNMISSVAGLVIRNEVRKVQCAIDIQEAETILETRVLTIENGSVNRDHVISKTSPGTSQSSNKCDICKKVVSVIPQLGRATTAAICAIVGAQITGPPGAASAAACKVIAQKVINHTSKKTNANPKSVCQNLGYCP